jgi:hypothetical protein
MYKISIVNNYQFKHQIFLFQLVHNRTKYDGSKMCPILNATCSFGSDKDSITNSHIICQVNI